VSNFFFFHFVDNLAKGKEESIPYFLQSPVPLKTMALCPNG